MLESSCADGNFSGFHNTLKCDDITVLPAESKSFNGKQLSMQLNVFRLTNLLRSLQQKSLQQFSIEL